MTMAMKFPAVVERALAPSDEKAVEASRQSFAKLVFGTVMAAGYVSALMAFLYPFVYYYYTYTPY